MYKNIELFNPVLSKITSVQKLINYADSLSENKYADNTLEYAIIVSGVLRNRFFHGFSNYSLNQNWIAAFTQFLSGYYVACPVSPKEILQYPYAGCSQQAIVLAEVMKRKKLNNHILRRWVGRQRAKPS